MGRKRFRALSSNLTSTVFLTANFTDGDDEAPQNIRVIRNAIVKNHRVL
jgi:hypothetical protein